MAIHNSDLHTDLEVSTTLTLTFHSSYVDEITCFFHSVAPFVELDGSATLVPFVGPDGFSYSGRQVLQIFSCSDTAGVGLA